jgi:hypothetical protein
VTDDAYAAWFNANSRCDVALRAWRDASPAFRAEAHRAYLDALDVEEAAAARPRVVAGRAAGRLRCHPRG